MTVSELRTRHPVFHYQDYKLDCSRKSIKITYNFLLEPDIAFHPQIEIPFQNIPDQNLLEKLVFNLGLIEAISYWKSACPPRLVVEAGPPAGEAGSLTDDQIAWWHELFINGLAEFFYQNDIDFTSPNFLTIISAARGGIPFRAPSRRVWTGTNNSASMLDGCAAKGVPTKARFDNLILVGGGKDSVVTLELLKEKFENQNVLLLNPTPAALATAQKAGFTDTIIVKRQIDPRLLELNKSGYLNGHTPFSAYLAFLSTLVAELYGFKNVIASNESSASECNTLYRGKEINHQYSKSADFEKKFRVYASKYLNTDINYFSFLRPLYELKIAQLFSRYEKYFSIFKSCNVGRGKIWCGNCAKCAFVYLTLSPFIEKSKMEQIFGSDLLKNPDILKFIKELVGLGKHKPFECVGTKEETVIALGLALRQYQKSHIPVPDELMNVWRKVKLTDADLDKKSKLILESWGDNFLPKEFEKILKEKCHSRAGGNPSRGYN